MVSISCSNRGRRRSTRRCARPVRSGRCEARSMLRCQFEGRRNTEPAGRRPGRCSLDTATSQGRRGTVGACGGLSAAGSTAAGATRRSVGAARGWPRFGADYDGPGACVVARRLGLERTVTDPFVLKQEPRTDLPHRQPIQRRHEPHDLTVAVDLVSAQLLPVVRPTPTSRTAAGYSTPPTRLHESLTLGRLRTPPRPLPHTTRRRQHNSQDLGSVATVDRNHKATPGNT